MSSSVHQGETGSRKPKRVRRKRSEALHRARQRTEYVLLRLVEFGVRCLPLVLAYWLAESILLGTMLVGPLRRRMRDTRDQLETAYGDDQDAAWKERVARESVRYFAWYLVDILLAPSRVQDAAWWECVEVAAVDEVLRRDGIGERSGAVLIGAHHGAPDVGSVALALAGWPHTSIINRIANPHVRAYIEERRGGVPRNDILQEGALRTCRRVLRGNGTVALQIDTDAGRNGIFVPYFGTLASTSGGAATLALITDSPVYMMAAVRTRRRRAAYRVMIDGPLQIERTGQHRADVKTLTAAATLAIEKLVREYPEQMMWTHRRWRTRPFQSRARKRQPARAARVATESGGDGGDGG